MIDDLWYWSPITDKLCTVYGYVTVCRMSESTAVQLQSWLQEEMQEPNSFSNGCCEQWLQAVVNVMGHRFADTHWTSLKYGSDCSGLDAPLWAVEALAKQIKDCSSKLTNWLSDWLIRWVGSGSGRFRIQNWLRLRLLLLHAFEVLLVCLPGDTWPHHKHQLLVCFRSSRSKWSMAETYVGYQQISSDHIWWYARVLACTTSYRIVLYCWMCHCHIVTESHCHIADETFESESEPSESKVEEMRNQEWQWQ